MSGHRDPWIACDVGNVFSCEVQYPEDAGEDKYVDASLRDLRADAKADGWRFTRDGRDICPQCQAAS